MRSASIGCTRTSPVATCVGNVVETLIHWMIRTMKLQREGRESRGSSRVCERRFLRTRTLARSVSFPSAPRGTWLT